MLPVFRPEPACPPVSDPQQEDPPCLRASLELRPIQICAPAARRFVTATLCGWQVPALVDDATLIASELATNALQAITRLFPDEASAPAFTVRLYKTAATLVIAVHDHIEAAPRRSAPRDGAENGRGLTLVAMIAKRSGHQPCAPGPGKVVWAELLLPTS